MQKIFLSLCAVMLLSPFSAAAWTHRLVESDSVIIENPLILQVYHDTLSLDGRAYRFARDDEWTLTLSLFAPKSLNPNGKFDAVVVNESNGTVATVLEAGNALWQEYYDPILAEYYMQGPTLTQELPAGNYRIVVTSSGNVGAYALRIGETKDFSLHAVIAEIAILPHLKKEFFRVSPATLILSPLMSAYLILTLCVGVLSGVLMRRHIPPLGHHVRVTQTVGTKNIDNFGRLLRLAIGLVLLVFAIVNLWNPILFAITGFSFYQAFSSWCALFAVLGRSSCPIDEA